MLHIKKNINGKVQGDLVTLNEGSTGLIYGLTWIKKQMVKTLSIQLKK